VTSKILQNNFFRREFLTTKLFVAGKKLIKLYNITGFLI
jgi:hypothetical protein